MNVETVSFARIAGWDDDGLAIRDKPNMANEPVVKNLVDELAIIDSAFWEPPYACAVSYWEGHWVSSFRFQGRRVSGLQVSSFKFQVSGFKFQVSGFRFQSFRFQVSGFKVSGFKVSGLQVSGLDSQSSRKRIQT